MLQIVQGDIFEVSFELCGIDRVAIEKVVFSSKSLGISEAAVFAEDKHIVRLESDRTANIPPGFSFYDLTIVFIDGQRLTAKRNEIVEVLKKENKADG